MTIVCDRSKPSTLNIEVFSDGFPEKKLQLVGMSILINPIKPWARMSHKVGTSLHSLSSKLSLALSTYTKHMQV
jgi:hypothetical protein